MGSQSQFVDKCIFTGLPVENIYSEIDAIEYKVIVGSHQYLIRLHNEAKIWQEKEPFFIENRHLFHALLQNNRWFKTDKQLINIDDLKELLSQSDYPQSPKQKMDFLFDELYKLKREDGQYVDVYKMLWEKQEWKRFYFKSVAEMMFYLKHLQQQGLVKLTLHQYGDIDKLRSFNITFLGLEYAIKLQEEGHKSKKCFIAMSFKPETKLVREAIRQALKSTGYEAVIIDEQIIDSDRTINDEIIAALKKCKFCIADFSFHSNGVYFESGFALGQGKKVIYTCNEAELKKAHFDIAPLQMLIYTSPEQLAKKLKDRIEAYID